MNTPSEWRRKMSPACASWHSWEWEEFISDIQDDALRSKPGRDAKLKEAETLLAEKNETANMFMAQIKRLHAEIRELIIHLRNSEAIGHIHQAGCPEDDTCDCPGMAIYKKLEKEILGDE